MYRENKPFLVAYNYSMICQLNVNLSLYTPQRLMGSGHLDELPVSRPGRFNSEEGASSPH